MTYQGNPYLLFPAAAGYSAEAVTFDGSTNDLTTTGATGLSDGKTGILSGWISTNNPGAEMGILNSTRVLYRVYSTTNKLNIQLRNSAGTLVLNALSNTLLSATGWHHILIAWDLSTTTFQWYIDDVDDSVTPSTITNDTAQYNISTWQMGSEASTSYLSADVADLYVNMDATLDISSSVNRRKFIDASVKPVDLGSDGSTPTGSQPSFFFKGNASTFNNAGYAGSFTVNGTLTNATSPSA